MPCAAFRELLGEPIFGVVGALRRPDSGLAAPAFSSHDGKMSDLQERVPGHLLIDDLLRQWDTGTIHIDTVTNGVLVGEEEGWCCGVLGERRVAALLATLAPGTVTVTVDAISAAAITLRRDSRAYRRPRGALVWPAGARHIAEQSGAVEHSVVALLAQLLDAASKRCCGSCRGIRARRFGGRVGSAFSVSGC